MDRDAPERMARRSRQVGHGLRWRLAQPRSRPRRVVGPRAVEGDRHGGRAGNSEAWLCCLLGTEQNEGRRRPGREQGACAAQPSGSIGAGSAVPTPQRAAVRASRRRQTQARERSVLAWARTRRGRAASARRCCSFCGRWERQIHAPQGGGGHQSVGDGTGRSAVASDTVSSPAEASTTSSVSYDGGGGALDRIRIDITVQARPT